MVAVDVMGSVLRNAISALVGFGTAALQIAAGLITTALTLGFKVVKFVAGKLMKMMKFILAKIQFAMKFGFNAMKFVKFIKAFAIFVPIMVIVTGIIMIATTGLYYVVLIIAWLAIAFIEIMYFVMSLPPFIWVISAIFFFITIVIPYFILAGLWLGLLLIITLLCLGIAFLNVISGGQLQFLVLCQNSPTSWYTIPSFQHGNKYMRGLFCSKPCKKGYFPEGDDGKTCTRLSKGAPSYCPQSQIMRFYTGVGSNDGQFSFADYKTKGNTKYLIKPVNEREDVLLDHFIKKVKHLERCRDLNNPDNITRYDNVTKNICANIDILQKTLPEKDFARLTFVCNEAFCGSKASYPFCAKMSKASDINLSELVKRIIFAIAAILKFCVIYRTTVDHLNG